MDKNIIKDIYLESMTIYRINDNTSGSSSSTTDTTANEKYNKFNININTFKELMRMIHTYKMNNTE